MSAFTEAVERLACARQVRAEPIPSNTQLAQSIVDATWLLVEAGVLPEHSRDTLASVAADLLRRPGSGR